MGRPKGSKNKTKVADKKATEVPKKIGRKEEITNEESQMEVSIINFDDFTLENRKKVGLRITNKKTEFAVLANSDSKQIELHFSIMKMTDDVKKIKDTAFNISVTPEVLKSFLDYIRETPRNDVMHKLKKLKDGITKSDKNANV